MEYRSNLAAKNNLYKRVPADLKQNWSLLQTRLQAKGVLRAMQNKYGDYAKASALIYKLDGTVEALTLTSGEVKGGVLSMSEFKELEDIMKREEIPYCIFYEERPNRFQVLSA